MNKLSCCTIAFWVATLLTTQGATERQRPLTIGLIGDSTVASTYGWGPALAARFKEPTRVLNVARNGATLDSLSGALDKLLEEAPDYVLIQFGHNDMKRYGSAAYATKLKAYVERVREVGSTAIVLSSVTRRYFDDQGKIKPAVWKGNPDRSLPVFARAARDVAKETGALFIDLNTLSIAHHNAIGPEASAAYHFNPRDWTHFSREGADAVAGLILSELKTLVPQIAESLK